MYTAHVIDYSYNALCIHWSVLAYKAQLQHSVQGAVLEVEDAV